MAEVILDEAEVVTAVGEREATGMAQHMRPDGRQAGTCGSFGDQIVDGLPSEPLPALGQE